MMLPKDLKPYMDQLGGYDRPTIHIAGSKGKGTTTVLLAELLKLKGKKVGRFLSPYILDEKECMAINSKNISQEDYDRLMAIMPEELSPFEKRTLMALSYFQEQKCDYVVLETGWGGRDDATNLVESKVLCIITHIELEHTTTLGPDIPSITQHKLGIIRPGVPTITSPNQDPEFFQTAGELEFEYSQDFELGYHHPEAVGHVMKAAELLGFELSTEDLSSLEKLQHLGRFEVIPRGIHRLILDGAHTPHSVAYIKNRVMDYVRDEGYENLHWCVHFLKDKADELNELFPYNSTWIEIEDERSGTNPKNFPMCSAKEMLTAIEKTKAPTVFVFTGSFKLVAAVKRALHQN